MAGNSFAVQAPDLPFASWKATFTRIRLAGFLLLLCHSGNAFSQTAHQDSPIVTAQVASVTPNPDDRLDSWVSVRIDVQATAKQLVVPYSSDGPPEKHVLWSARLMRFNGKTWRYAKPKWGVVLGLESTNKAIPLTIAPGERESYSFSFSTRLFLIRKGERLRIGFEVWSDPETMRDNNATATLLTPVFKAPSN